MTQAEKSETLRTIAYASTFALALAIVYFGTCWLMGIDPYLRR